MNPPPAIAPLPREVASATAFDQNEVIDAGVPEAAADRNTIYVSGFPRDLTESTGTPELEDPIDYSAATAVLRQAESIDDDVEAPYHPPIQD